jgi:ERCC4-type nuclease
VILLDDRGGSTTRESKSHYPTLLASLIPGAILTRLDSADVAFTGTRGITVGIELKRVTDALSCMYSGRLADLQLPTMAQAYDIRYLIVEELYRAEPNTGVLQRYQGKLGQWGRWTDAIAGRNRVMYSAFEMWLHTLSEQGGARLEKTADIEGTASLIQALYCWWQREEHASYNVMHLSQGDTAALSRPTVMRRIAAQLPHIGWKRSEVVAKRFRSVAEMAAATEEDWKSIDGIGDGIAKSVVEAINNGKM